MYLKHILVILSLAALSLSLQGVTDLTDGNFEELVTNDGSIWLVAFTAEWCGHCKHLKPELEKVAPRLQKMGVKVGHVDQKKNQKLINAHVVDHTTHMVSYPKVKVFLGEEVLAQVPSNFRNSELIYNWMVNEYNLSEVAQSQL